MDNNNKENTEMKTFNIIATFSDGVVLKGSVAAKTSKNAEMLFMDSKEVKSALKENNRRMLQYSIYEQDNNWFFLYNLDWPK